MRGLERVNRARSQLMIDAPFFGSLALHLDMKATTEFETMATDGKRLLVNEAFADSLTDAELRGVLAHEVLHCSNGHMTRKGKRDHKQWNVACDHAINLDLVEMGFTLPRGALLDARFKGMTAESIYAALERQNPNGKPRNQSGSGSGTGTQGNQPSNQTGSGAPQPGNGKPQGGAAGNDPGMCGEIIEAEGTEADAAALDADWQGKTLMAAAIAKRQAGSLPGSLARLVDELRAPRVDWRDVLRRFISDSMVRDYSWTRPNRRHVANGLYLPSLVSNGRGRIIVAIDTSGSIDRAALRAFNAELQAAMDDGAADCVTVLYCDDELQGTAEFSSGDSIRIETTGGGGTSFAPVMDWIADNGTDAACLVYFTDLDCYRFGNDPGLPVIWANWDKPRGAPFGEVIQIDGHA